MTMMMMRKIRTTAVDTLSSAIVVPRHRRHPPCESTASTGEGKINKLEEDGGTKLKAAEVTVTFS